jgi:hypothetical protein
MSNIPHGIPISHAKLSSWDHNLRGKFDIGGYDPMKKVWHGRLEFHEECLTWEVMILQGKFDMVDYDLKRKA